MDQTIVIQYSLIAATIISAIASISAAFNDSKVAKAAIDGTTRQPEMAGQLFTNMLVGIGMVESIAIVLVFANPFLG